MSVGCVYTRLNLLLQTPRLMLFHHPSCAIHASSATLAGHNKWSKVKNVKGPKDTARALVFQKLAMMIRFAVREGGSNPNFNSNLANLIEVCRRKNMPKASIETAISGAEKTKSIYHLCGIRGPGGSSFYVEILTDNLKRCSNEIRHLLNKNGGSIADGIHSHFEKKGVVTVSKEDKSGRPLSLDRALELAIEAGAEDVQEEEEEDEKVVLKFISAVSTLHQVREKLESLGLCSLSAGLEFIPIIHAQLSDAEMDGALKLIEALEDHMDVVRVYNNIA
ncbi:translational activator of cytochrome c oxidase 1 [Python bivittatus]|uniref:Translational activator of cytochrome c oxidase 1 n=1 Tax=Python bivittatus TaxID=176946 RepID=A0A9F2WLU7_PYTBI|nr:translational activator of cytochrome c oxidase 1 [Python bivittatus]XP_007443628.1 translational activator of cytochrome c oxidase 1 [Python bivittatus]XP_015746476.1 translational activator of cytochrome c oxidase 1 [Python bivittatus]